MSRRGQALSEYPIILALAAVVAIGGLTYLGMEIAQGHMNNADEVAGADALYGLLDSNGNGSGGQGGGQGGVPQQHPGTDPPVLMSGTNPQGSAASSGVQLTTGSGLTITLPDYPTDLGQSVETAGANGTTETLLASLETVIQQLKDAGEIDEGQANQLQALANQGHRIAEIEGLIDTLIDQHGDDLDAYGTETVSLDGQDYTLVELASSIGWSDYDLSTLSDPLNADSAKPETLAFIELFNEAERDGAMDSPAIRKLVADLSSKINVISEASSVQTFAVAGGTTAAADFQGNIAQDTTDAHASGICGAGGGQDSGVHCP